jgi:hypothetical protein
MSAALTEKEVRFAVKALIQSGYIEAEGLENLYANQKAFLSCFLDGTLDGEPSEYRRGDDLSAKGGALFEKLRALNAAHREAIVKAAAVTQARCADGSMDVDQALDSEAPSGSGPVVDKPVSEPEKFGRCPCSSCSVIIEFPIQGVGQTVACPKCGFGMLLFDSGEG